jgi:hypothetical protein
MIMIRHCRLTAHVVSALMQQILTYESDNFLILILKLYSSLCLFIFANVLLGVFQLHCEHALCLCFDRDNL